MVSDSERFRASGRKLTAYEIAREGDSAAWNAWRQETDLFGDHHRNRINLSNRNLRGVDFQSFNLTNVSFYQADLTSCDLSGTDCAYSDFHECKLIGATLRKANLRSARLSRAYLRGASLDFADLRGADLRRSSVTDASMVGTDLRGVDLRTTRGLTQDQLDDAIGDLRTKIPDHLTVPPTWEMYDEAGPRQEEDIENLHIVPASIEVAVMSGVVDLSPRPGDAYFASTMNPESLKREILGDIAQVLPRIGNIPELSRAITQYVDELSKPEFDVIMVGIRGLKIQSIFNAIASSEGEAELLPDAVGSMRAVLIQHFLYINQSHRWKAFLEEYSLAPYTDKDKETAKKLAAEVASILEDHGDACSPRVPAALKGVSREIEINDDSQKFAIFNAIASVENVFKGVVTWLVREAKRFSGEAWSEFRNDLSKVVGKGMAKLIGALVLSGAAYGIAAQFPERFGWLMHAIELVKSAVG